MKKQLLTILLTFATIPCFATSSSALLAHLKKCKADTLYMLYDREKDINMVKNGQGDPGFKEMMNLWNDLFNVMDPSGNQITADADTCFDLICQKQETIHNLLNDPKYNDCIGNLFVTIAKIIDSQDKNLDNPQIKKNYTLVFSTIAKHIRYPWYNYFNNCLKDPHLEQDINGLFEIGDFFCMGNFLCEAKILRKLLPKLDATIEKLEIEELEEEFKTQN